jgi:hypothetical protein
MQAMLIIGLVCAPIAGLMAFLITYEEYSHHFPDRRAVLRMSAEAGITAALFLGALWAVALYVIGIAVKG